MESIFISLLMVAAFTEEYQKTQDLVPEMIFVKGGYFQMGDTNGSGQVDELPVRYVKLDDYYIAQTEVTVLQWKQYCLSQNIAMPAEPKWKWNDNHPIVNITWNDAVLYCEWISKKTNKRFRLPTEAEWEFAAKGGNKSRGSLYSGTNDINKSGYYKSTSPVQTQAVGQKVGNELDLFDMSGNAWEWCANWYHDTYAEADSATNPTGVPQGQYRVIRGGGWVAPAGDLRVTNRWRSDPASPQNYLGFRPVMEAARQRE